MDVPNEVLLVLYDGDDDVSSTRTKGAYYKTIERKVHLKKKRANVSVLRLDVLGEILIDLRHTTNMRTNGKLSVCSTPP